jgi:hypothetical protein
MGTQGDDESQIGPGQCDGSGNKAAGRSRFCGVDDEIAWRVPRWDYSASDAILHFPFSQNGETALEKAIEQVRFGPVGVVP